MITLVCGPAVTAGSQSVLGECWARVGESDIETYPLVCRKPVDPDGIGLCPEHLALYRQEPAQLEADSLELWPEWSES